MSIKKKIQQSMTVILTVTLVLAYVILSVILYNRNMNLLQTEVKQEAAYIREAINLSDSDYMKQMDNVVESTRVTQIKADGTVLYDSRRDADILKNHGNRTAFSEPGIFRFRFIRTAAAAHTRNSVTGNAIHIPEICRVRFSSHIKGKSRIP